MEREPVMKKSILTIAIISLALLLVVQPAAAAINTFYEQPGLFDTAAGSPPVRVNFDTIAAGTDISGTSINGITFTQGPAAAPLIVIRAADSYTPTGFSWSDPANKLYATSGENVLSPGGVELAPGPTPGLENDDITLVFNAPVSAVGFDLLFQSLDGASYVYVTLFDGGGNTIYSTAGIPVSADPDKAGGSAFVGFVSDTANIKKVVLEETDENEVNPDANIGIDTIRAEMAPSPVPEFPSTLLPVTLVAGVLLTAAYLNSTRRS